MHIDSIDTNLLAKMVDLGVKKIKISFFRALCNTRLYCCKNRLLKAQRLTAEKFESHLDVRDLMKVQLNLNQLLNMLLTPAQKFLFLHHRGRLVHMNDTSTSDENDIWTFNKNKKVKKMNIQELLHDYKA